MTKADLIKLIAEKSEMTFNDAETVVNEILSSMINALQEGDEIELRGFGVFRQRQRNARTGHNPKTLKPVKIPAKRVVYFKIGKELKEAMLKQSDESALAKSEK
jgi:integration host factor subunit beta